MVGREKEMQWLVEKGKCNGGERKGNAMYWFHRHRMNNLTLCVPTVTIMGPAMELGS